MKSKLYISKEYFKCSPEKSGFAMMTDGEVFFYQIEQQAGKDLNCGDLQDLREVAQIDTEDVLIYKKIGSLVDVTVSNEKLFTQLIAKYDKEKPLIHKSY